MDFLIGCFEDAAKQFSRNNFMRESIEAGHTKMLEYWNKTARSPAYIAAIVLDPTTKYTYFKHWKPEWQPDMKFAMRDFWEKTSFFY